MSTIANALYNAVDWQRSIADAYHDDLNEPAVQDAMKMIKAYQKEMRRRKLPIQNTLEKMLDGMETKSIYDIMRES